MNDVLDNIQTLTCGAIFADDLVKWCSEEYRTTATVKMQEALRGWRHGQTNKQTIKQTKKQKEKKKERQKTD